MPRGQFDRTARKARTRARLLEAAAQVYAQRGLDGATLDEVAAAAGFTKGAVYAHFGNKENLMLALVEEYLTGQVVEQMALFDRERAAWERPLAGSERWMDRLQERPERFRLFVELWSHAQRDERLRERLAGGLAALQATFASFSSDSAADAGIDAPPEASEQFGKVVLALGMGLSLLKLADADAVPGELLGVTLSILVRALESSEQVREQLARLDPPS